MTQNKRRHNVSPGDGERRAMVGFKPQYRIAAEFIYERLLAGTLEWVRITDPDAGAVDDILIATPGSLDAYQVKWGQDVQTITFEKFVTNKLDSKGKFLPSLIRELADGWAKLVSHHPLRHVRVNLISKHLPSPTADIPREGTPVEGKSFQAFLRTCWTDRTWADQGLNAVPTAWHPAMKRIRKSTGLEQEAFLQFVRACSLRFTYQLSRTESVDEQSARTRNDDVERIQLLLFDLAGGEKRTVQISREQLINQLGWSERFSPRFRHDFFVNERLYQPIEVTVNDLEQAFERFTQGYVALVGSPGSGKSTTLTKMLRYREGVRVVRYYAYVPEDAQLGRGEAYTFLHDLTLALRSHGIRGQDEALPTTRSGMQNLLGLQLQELAARWNKEKTRTLILVDGLDHIEREQHPERSLVADLPLPNSIPDGVLFILGSQKIDLAELPGRIKTQLELPGRTIEMARMNRASVHEFLDAVGLGNVLDGSRKEQVSYLSNGHPLALAYLARRLREMTDVHEVDRILSAANPFGESIREEYEGYWRSLADDDGIRDLLGLMCRVRGNLHMREVMRWADRPVMTRFVPKARHYFRQTEEYHWQFFHNSFRQFLLAKTSENPLGVRDDEIDHGFHKRLANFAVNAGRDSPWRWQELYHRACAGDDESVIELGRQQYFREQFFSLRSLQEIREDISTVLRVARRRHDGLAVTRMFLVEKELADRDDALEMVDVPDLLLRTRGGDAAMRCLMRGPELRVSAEVALAFSGKLVVAGLPEYAQELFNAAEPLEFLSGTRRVDIFPAHAGREQLEKWARVAHHFRPIEQIVQSVEQVQIEADGGTQRQNPEQERERLLYSLLCELMYGVYEEGNIEKLQQVRELFGTHRFGKDLRLDLDFKVCSKREDTPECQEALDRTIADLTDGEIGPDDRIFIAEFLYRIKGDADEVAKWLEGVEQPGPVEGTTIADKESLTPFLPRIFYNRLKAALGSPTDPALAVPDLGNGEKQGMLFFERMLVLIANLWGKGWRGEQLNPAMVMHEVQPALIFFARRLREGSDWLDWYQIRRLAPEYLRLLIAAVRAHGEEALQELDVEFGKQWSDPDTKRSWPLSWRREIAQELYKVTGTTERLKERLAEFEKDISPWDETYERIAEYEGLAQAWLDIGEKEQAERLLRSMHCSSFGICGDKDNQFGRWVEWSGRANEAGVPGVQERIRRFVTALVTISQARRGAGIDHSAQDLLKIATLHDPDYALKLRDWLLDQNTVSYTSLMEGIVLGACQNSEPPVELIVSLAAHLLAPFQRSCSQRVAEEIGRLCGEMSNAERAAANLANLRRAIETRCFPNERRNWWLGLRTGLRKEGQEYAWLEEKLRVARARDRGDMPPTITLESGEVVDEDTLRSRIASFVDLLTVIRATKSTDHFHWDRLLRSLAPKLSADEVERISVEITRLEPGLTVNCVLASRLAELGFPDRARALADEALENSSPGGWDKWYDGGSRFSAAELLVAVDPTDGRSRAFDLLVEDYLAEVRFPATFVRILHDLLPILFEGDPPMETLWPEIDEHISQLIEFQATEPVAPQAPDDGISVSLPAVLCRFLITDYQLPVNEMGHECHRALCEIVASGGFDSELVPLVTKLLTEGELAQLRGLSLLESAVFIRQQFVSAFQDQTADLAISPNVVVRRMALGVCSQMSTEVSELPVERQQLPAIYRMALPELKMPDWQIPFEALDPSKPFPDSKDPLEMVRPHEPLVRMISRISGIPFENVLYQTAGFMRQLESCESWSAAAEENLRDWFKAAELKLAYHRPRAGLALRAIAHVTAELLDADSLTQAETDFLWLQLSVHDPVLSALFPEPRPESVLVPPDDCMKAYPEEEWFDRVEERFGELVTELGDGRVVFAEMSRFASLEWQKPTEDRLSRLVATEPVPTAELEKGEEAFFEYHPLWRAFSYPYLVGIDEEYPSVAVRGSGWQLELGNIEWLAINPLVALKLGWKPSEDGIFRWVDNQGQTVVESIWWSDGPISRLPPHFGNVCAEGWLVVASPGAAKQLRAELGYKWRAQTVTRSVSESNARAAKRKSAFSSSNFTVS